MYMNAKKLALFMLFTCHTESLAAALVYSNTALSSLLVWWMCKNLREDCKTPYSPYFVCRINVESRRKFLDIQERERCFFASQVWQLIVNDAGMNDIMWYVSFFVNALTDGADWLFFYGYQPISCLGA